MGLTRLIELSTTTNKWCRLREISVEPIALTRHHREASHVDCLMIFGYNRWWIQIVGSENWWQALNVEIFGAQDGL